MKYLISGAILVLGITNAQNVTQSDDDLTDEQLMNDADEVDPFSMMRSNIGAPADSGATKWRKTMVSLIKRRWKQTGKKKLPGHVRTALVEYKHWRREQRRNGMRGVDSMDRGIMNCEGNQCNVKIMLTGVWNYGCWCNMGDDLMTGRGPAMNRVDEKCRDLQLCLRCAKLDGKDDGEYCDPKTVEYQAQFGNQQGGLDVLCAGLDNCEKRTCMCEIDALNEFLGMLWDGQTYEDTYMHSKWDQAANCGTNQANRNNQMECCGKYPSRFPYAGARDCCKDTTIYNPVYKDCCPDGSSAEPGLC